jgi:outer membrane protein assembly factor BamB
MFFVTFHQAVSNVYAYDDDGNLLNRGMPNVLNSSANELDELRGIYFINDYLYVINGGKKASNILCFQGSGTSFNYLSMFVSNPANGPIYHPFAMAMDGNGHCFVSNQDSNVVAALNVLNNKQATLVTTPSAFLQARYPSGSFLAGTLVASSNGALPDMQPTTPVPQEFGGLDVSIVSHKGKGKVQNSVRDLAYNQGLLFVLDEPGGLVRSYNAATGQPLGVSNTLDSPTHLLINGATMYVSAGNQVLTSPIPNPQNTTASSWAFQPLLSLGSSDSASGMAFDSSGNFYVGNRSTNKVHVFDSNNGFRPGNTWPQMPDNPEFLLYMGG